jgi:RimJ/RimL family protein N-acetyltransferase
MEINNKTLYLRAFETTDLNYLINLRSQSDLLAFTVGNSYFGSSEYTKKLLNENLISDGKNLYLMICKVVDKEPVGYISLIDIDHVNKRALIGGVIIDPYFSGNGYGTLAIKEALDFLFFQQNMNKVYGYWLSSNAPSLKIAKKLGFQEEGLLRKHVFKNKMYNDVFILSIFKDEYIY